MTGCPFRLAAREASGKWQLEWVYPEGDEEENFPEHHCRHNHDADGPTAFDYYHNADWPDSAFGHNGSATLQDFKDKIVHLSKAGVRAPQILTFSSRKIQGWRCSSEISTKLYRVTALQSAGAEVPYRLSINHSRIVSRRLSETGNGACV